MNREFSMDQLAEGFRVLGDRTRLRILALLRDGEQCVCDLTEVLGISQPGVSQQMRKLRQAGLVKERRGGQWIYYSLNPEEPMLKLILPLLPDVPEERERLRNSSGCEIQLELK